MALNKNIKILLVEDAGVMRKMEIKTLNSLDFNNIIEAKNGNDAVVSLQKDPSVELIISDWNMPKMDGFEMLRHLKEGGDLTPAMRNAFGKSADSVHRQRMRQPQFQHRRPLLPPAAPGRSRRRRLDPR